MGSRPRRRGPAAGRRALEASSKIAPEPPSKLPSLLGIGAVDFVEPAGVAVDHQDVAVAVAVWPAFDGRFRWMG